ncbi:DUF982 domain-containing protein [Agrobacterium rhizogenes]|nr:DUF982 domain-containing protein [Rhizobium rhizogenes]NTH66666.1 DUF982 domain-containing protein [Rhizobium rhizogenes]
MNDSDVPAFAPVEIAILAGGGYIVVDTIERAVECLTDRWPVRKGVAYEKALQACIDAMNGRTSPRQVRQAFINAAKEAGIPVLV